MKENFPYHNVKLPHNHQNRTSSSLWWQFVHFLLEVTGHRDSPHMEGEKGKRKLWPVRFKS